MLCTAGPGCFRCCPPLRPAGYDHLPWRTSLLRLLADNTERYRRGERGGQILGWWCWGLGFVGPGRVGCLLHPTRNSGQDLRELTGYRFKCASYWCVEARAFAALPPAHAAWLVETLGPRNPFEFSSSASSLMRLLAFGPEVAGTVACGCLPADKLKYLLELEPRSGWIVEQIVKLQGPQVLVSRELGEIVGRVAGELRALVRAGVGGRRLGEVVSLWEERAWRWLGAGPRVGQEELGLWRRRLAEAIERQG